jgi:hypothetical protein
MNVSLVLLFFWVSCVKLSFLLVIVSASFGDVPKLVAEECVQNVVEMFSCSCTSMQVCSLTKGALIGRLVSMDMVVQASCFP